MRVAQVLAGAPIGGAENFYTRLVCALQTDAQLDQCAFTRSNDYREAQLAAAGVPVSLHRLGGKLDLLGHRQYRKALIDWRPDIVATYMNRASGLTPNSRSGFDPNASPDSGQDYTLVARLGHYYDLKYYRHCDYWIGIAKGICQHMIDGGFPAERVFHIPNFVDETLVPALDRQSLDADGGQPVLLAVGRLHVNKGFDTLIRALQDVPGVMLWLAGDGPERLSLEALTAELNLTNRVRFLGWRRDINALMRTADVFVCPSRHEGLGSIIGEAWFNRVPIAATRSQGPSELIEHGRTGLLSDIDDIDALASHLRQLFEQPALRQTLVEAGAEEYDRYYARSIVTKQYSELYRRLRDR
ncbi:glycosyltransferase [Allohahella marinimesophila]|uniref:Glycosyltransferase n=2 Tax=Allohahella marinimesophila TaxID=1054972 RepID=A0ABP7PLW6_9GAMM